MNDPAPRPRRSVRFALAGVVALGVLLVVSSQDLDLAQRRPRGGGVESWQRHPLLQKIAAKQDQGYDISPALPYMQLLRGASRHERDDIVRKLMKQLEGVVSELPAPPRIPPGPAQLRVDASESGAAIPRLAGSIVVQNLDGDERWRRFMTDIGPELIQVKLFLSELDKKRSNYYFRRADEHWPDIIRDIHRAGGEVMLHLRNVPSRLTARQSENDKPYTGRAPLTDKGNEEWKTIVREVIAHFAADPETRFDYVQAIGEPNIGTNWYDPKMPGWRRPDNSEEFAVHFRDTLEAARAADPRVEVGGPTLWFSSNDEIWWDGFLGYLSRHQVPLGFVSVHIYDANFGIWDRGMEITRRKMKQYGFADTPVVMTEWNLSLDNSLENRQKMNHLNASHATVGLKRILDTGMRHTYFYMGPGREAMRLRPGVGSRAGGALMFIRNGKVLPNTSYNALRLFAKLHDKQRLTVTGSDPRIESVAGRDDDEVVVMATFYEPLTRDMKNERFAYRDPDWTRSQSVELRIDDLPFEHYELDTYRIDREHSNVHTLGPAGAELERVSTETLSGRGFERRLEVPLYGVQLLHFRKTSPPSTDS